QLELCVDGSIATQPPIEGDRRRLWQVFTNLLGNAIKFTPDGGEIRISATPWNGECRVSIADNGIGIPAEKLEAVFEPFVTLENPMLHSSSKSAFMGGGIGLGLTIAQGIVEAHGGKIWAESNEAGALFHLTLPYHPHGR
ncbi:MAG: ATP-binding protein, partial [Deltaproteobacteria bacterium]